jgi:SpoVK/Ycf46/Vps4 family AAA+-type ATPase
LQRNGSFATITIRTTTETKSAEPVCESCKTKIAQTHSPVCASLYTNKWVYYCGRCIERNEHLKNTLANAENCVFYNPHEQEVVFDWKKRNYKVEKKSKDTPPVPTPSPVDASAQETVSTQDNSRALSELDGLIGLHDVKEQLHKWVKRIKGQRKLEQARKIKMETPMMHCFFVGPPGTGKTVTARLLKDILFENKIIKKNVIVETDAGGLIAEYVGHTAQKVNKVVESALGGVLFIDEAYSLANRNGHNAKFASEALDTLIKLLEDHRQDLVVIFAGYDGDMEKLFEMNQGLQSRVPHHFEFTNYTPVEMKQIVEKMLREKGYRLDQHLSAEVEKTILSVAQNGVVPGNGRWGRTFAERISEEHLIRIADTDPADLTELFVEDIRRARGNHRPLLTQQGLFDLQKEAFRKLDDLVGLEQVKSKLKQMMNFYSVMQRKHDAGISMQKPMMHMFFIGNPGTCKTTVARITGELLRSTGMLSRGHLVEATKSDFVSPTGITTKTQDVLKKAKGGVLFFDEAYALTRDPISGKEALDSIIKAMEDQRDDLVVILAGYPEEMAALLQMNPGLRSRAPHAFYFPDYKGQELLEITLKMLTEQKLYPNNAAQQVLQNQIHKQFEMYGVLPDNGRWARNFVEKAHIAQANRLAENPSSDLLNLLPDDVHLAFQEQMGRA